MRYLSSRFWGLLTLLLAGCGEDEAIVARVGEVEIEQAEFAAFVEHLPPGLRSPKEGRAADREHLQSMIDEELMFVEARALGIDTSLAVEHQLREMVRQRLVERYRAQVILPQVEITAADVERAFAEMGFDRERLFSRILVRTREELAAVGRDLRTGQPFEEVAARFAANDLFALQGDGVVGWIGRTQAERRFFHPARRLCGFARRAGGRAGRAGRRLSGLPLYRGSPGRARRLQRGSGRAAPQGTDSGEGRRGV